jgi:plastocyanin domain-containing protein
MFIRFQMVYILTILGLLLSTTGNSMAQMSTHPSSTTEFRRLEQPFALKVGFTAGGLALIGLELWWFLFSKPKSRQAEARQGIQEVSITVDGGYEPAYITVKMGQLVRLNFLRRDPSSCLEKVLLPDFRIAQDLGLNQITPIEFMPEKPGKYSFTCGMNMFRGILEVQASAAIKQDV